jgi:RHS repeat-associated protein
VLFNNAFVTPTNADNDVLTLAATGAYTILLEGGIGDTGTGSYTFNAQPVTISSTPLALNTRTDGAISVPGEQDEFTFSAQPGARIFFDGLEGTTTMTVRLVAPGGATVFTTNSISNVGPLYLFESGTYRVVVDPAGDVTGAYSFRVLTVTDAPEVIPGQNNTGTIDPARESDIFRINAPAGQRLLLIPGTELFVGTAAQVSAATRSLEISGGFEDGYDGMEVGLTHGAFRPGAAINVVVITDEDRDILDPALNFANMLTALTSRNALLNAVNDATFRDPQNRVLLGVDSQSNGYLADGAGGFTIVPNSRFASAGDVTTKVDYVDLAWATTGAAWDLNQLRVGGLPAQSFTRAFVEIKAREIEEQLRLTVVSSDPNITFENLTGTLTGIGGGETATFTTRITGDGAAHSFDLLFVRPNSGVVLGSIPVTLNNDYVYPVRAVDADNDPITYRLLEGPAGATIDPTTGRLIWEPTQAGTFQFAVQADDGRGGRDTQSYAVVVTQGAANVAPTITSPAPTVATVGLPFGHQVTATDPDGDLLSYYLTQSPSGMSIDRTTGRITWTPTAAQIGAHPVSIRVLDGRGGSATQSFNMTVSADTGNRAPRFTSSPSLTVPLGDPYAYASVATDPDFDLLRYDLVVRPDGMAVDASTGRVTWRPTSEQIGEHTVILRVVDGRGGIDLQSFTVTVTVANTPPIVTSIPPGPATVGLPYQYQVRAQDADGDPLAFQLSRSPAGMTINGTTGLLTWTAAANQVGDHPVDVVVSDGRGGSVVHSFTLPAVAAPTNRGPTITSLPRGSVGLGERYLYQVVASDPDGDPLGYLLTTAPAGMTIDASTGLVTWEPAANQLGAHTVVIRVEDGRGGFATQTYTLQVLSQPAANQPPTITSTPSQSATLGIAYRYDAQATDPDGDTLVWSLDAAPAGASIDAMTGSIRWTPIATQLGSQAFTVRVADPQGAFSTQSFTVVVFAVNQGPNITSTPPTTANAGRAYTYAVRATDPDGDPLRYSLTAGPAGMIINQTTGVIQWTPQVAQVGSHTVTIRVDDGRGGIANQTYTVVVSASAVNRPPIITSQPPTQATADLSYTYAVIAADPDGDALMFSLAAAPTGMTIHPTTGVINWTPLASQAGVHTVTVRASDAGSFAQQTYQVRVTVNTPPTITRTPPPPSTVTLGQTYRYDVRASDPQGQPLNYQLVQGPAGMTIDSLGRITWTPTPTQLGNHTVEVRVRDPLGAGETLTFPLVVSPDTQSPGVSIQLSGNPIDRGTSVTILVNATDNVGVVNRQVTVNGTPVALDANGRATITMPNVGAFPVVATARDSAGNTGTATATLTVIDRTDVTAPFVELISPADEAIITAPTDVRGTVTDTNLLFYTLSIKPFGRGQFVEFARGTAPVIDGVLGKLDPSQLENDTYTLRLSATDAGGNVSNDDRIISVTGDLKLGNFTLSFTDLEVPVAGVPITLTRTYDTLRSNGTTDMGFGWRLDIRDTDLRTNVPPSGLEEYDIYSPFRDGTRVFVTLPGGKREGFTFKPRLAPGLAGAFLRFYEPFFEADKGVTSKLSVQSLYLIRLPDGTFNGFSSIPYNPASSLYGGSFTMTTKEGLRYQIDGATGSMSQVSDTNGNTLSITRAGIISSAGLRILFERDPQGRIVAVVDPAGNKIRYGYDARGDLVSVTDRENNVTRFEYRTDRAHYLDKVIDPLGRTGIRSEYDASGRLVKLIDAGGKQIELIHNPDNFTQTVKDQLGNPTFYEYDVRGNIITEIDAEGGVTRRTFDDRNNLLTEKVILASGTELLTQRTYDANGNVLNETDPLGNVTRNTYGPFNRLRTSTDALGNTTTNDINAKGNVLKTTDPTGAVTSFSYDSAGNPLTLTFGGVQLKAGYNLAGDLIRQEDGLGNVTTYTHDSNGNLKTQTHSLSTPGGIRTLVRSTDYNRNGDVVKVTDEEGGVTRTEYDAAGNKTAVIDARGNRTVYRYDERNKLIETIYPDATPADLTDNPRRRSEYDAAGREIARIDEMGMRTEYRYDKVGRLIETIYPDATPGDLTNNPRTKKEYDATGRVTATIDERGNRTEFQYDLAGNRTLVRDALGLTTITTYDAVNRESSSTDALGRITRYTYDAAGRQLETIFADGTKLRSVYDSNGRVSSRTDQLGRTTRSEYDARGLLKAVIDAKNQRTEYGYDEDGNLISEKDANGHITRYEYDGLNQRIATVLPLGQRSTARYDGVGNVINTTDFNGDVITYRYNERNMLVAKEFPNGSLVSFTYSPTGERETATDGRGTTSWEYDERSRLVSRTEPDGTSISYTYDLAGNRTSVTTPAGMTTYTFDAINRMTTVTDPQVGVTRYFYDNVSNVIRTERPNSTVETRQYDALNQLTFLENRNSAGVLSSYRYTLAANGRRDAVVEHDGRRVDYSYDELDRLTREQIADTVFGNRTIDYTYDPVANRLTRNDSVEGLTRYTYDNNDRLVTEELAGQITQYTHDANGNLVSKVSPTEQVFYDWDFENRLVGVDTDGDGTIDVTNSYDADGIRVAQTVGGQETRFLIDQVQPYQQVALEYRPSGLIVASYVHGLNLLSQLRGGVQLFYHVDGLGSVRALTDALATVVKRYAYDAFGRTLGESGAAVNVYQYAGEQRDPAVGLDYLRARYFDPRTGRFVSRDPFEGVLSVPLTLTDYLYGLANPVIFTDPSGRIFSLGGILAGLNIQSSLRIGSGVAARQAAKKAGCIILEFTIEEAVTHGIYIFIDDFGVYVGKSVDVERRLKQHGDRVKQLIAKIRVINVDPKDLRQIEQYVLDRVRDFLGAPGAVRGPGSPISNKINPVREFVRKVINIC